MKMLITGAKWIFALFLTAIWMNAGCAAEINPYIEPETWHSLDDEARKSVIAQYNVFWNGEIKPGEVRRVDLLAADGPYLPVESGAGVEITLTDQKGGSGVVKTPNTLIKRTD